MNLLAKSEVFAENKLFATLDTTVRKMTIDNLPFTEKNFLSLFTAINKMAEKYDMPILYSCHP